MTAGSERQKIITWQDPSPAVQMAPKLSGLAYLTAMLKGELPIAPIGNLLDFRFREVENGRVVMASLPGEQHHNAIQHSHGAPSSELHALQQGIPDFTHPSEHQNGRASPLTSRFSNKACAW